MSDARGDSVDDPAFERPDAHPHVYFLDPREARPVNANTPEGEIRNMAAFAAGVHGIDPWRRMIIKGFVWLVLLGIALGIIAGIASGFRTF